MSGSPSSSSIRLTKGSGTRLQYVGPDAQGNYVPLDLDRNALADGDLPDTYEERQPDGLVLCYGCEPPSSSSSSSSGSSSSDTSSSGPPRSIEYVLCDGGGGSGSSSEASTSSGSSSAPPPSSSSSSSSESCDVPLELGYVRNLLPSNYAMPFFGNPIDAIGATGRAEQPMLCTIDQEVFCEPCQPISMLSNPAEDLIVPRYPVAAVDAAAQHVQSLCQGFRLATHEVGMNAGAVRGTVGVNLNNGNLVVTFCLPGGGPADPPIRFYYNSHCLGSDSGYGFGWTGLYRQWVEQMQGSSSSPSSGGDRIWLTRITNPAGRSWHLDRDDIDGRILAINGPFGTQTAFAYDNDDQLVSVTDSGGRTSYFEIDDNGLLVSVTSPAGFKTRFEYDDEYLLTRWINPEGNVTAFGYDPCCRITTITTPEAEVTRYTYLDSAPPRRIVTDARNHATTITQDGYGNAAVVEMPESITVTYTWDSMQRLQGYVDGRGNPTTFTYASMADHSRRITAAQQPIGTLTLAYDAPTARLVSITDQNANVTTLAWDILAPDMTPGIVDSITDARSKNYTLSYNDAGQIESITDPLAHTTTYTFDGRARRQAVTNAESETTTFSYSGHNQAASMTDPTGATSFFTRDQDNRVLTITDPNTHSTWFEYDNNGRLTASENALFKKWRQTYDRDGRLSSETDPEGNTQQFRYDPASNVVATVSPRGHTTTHTYDDANRMIGVENPLSNRTTYTYDAADNRTSIRNALNEVTSFSFDANNRLATQTTQLGFVTAYAYDPVGNQIEVTDPLLHITTSTYDAGYNLTATTNAENETHTYYLRRRKSADRRDGPVGADHHLNV